MSKSNNELAIDAMEELKRLKLHVDAERANHNMVTPPNTVKLEDYVRLKERFENLQDKIRQYQDDIQFSKDQESIINGYLTDNKAIQKYCDDNIARFQGKAVAAPVTSTSTTPAPDEAKDTTVVSQPKSSYLSQADGLSQMEALLQEAKKDYSKKTENQNKVMSLLNKVEKKDNVVFLDRLKEILSEFKKLSPPAAAVNQSTGQQSMQTPAPITSNAKLSTPSTPSPAAAGAVNYNDPDAVVRRMQSLWDAAKKDPSLVEKNYKEFDDLYQNGAQHFMPQHDNAAGDMNYAFEEVYVQKKFGVDVNDNTAVDKALSKLLADWHKDPAKHKGNLEKYRELAGICGLPTIAQGATLPAERKSAADTTAQSTKAVESLPVVAQPAESVMPAGGINAKDFKAQMAQIAKDNKFGISFAGDVVKIQDKGEAISVSSDKNGLKIQGSAELGAKVLDKWCDNNKFDKLDVKVTMPSVKKDIDPKSAEGAAALKSFEEYTKKGFYVKDFPIDNFKPAAGQDQTQFNALKAQYTDLQQRAESRAEQKMGPRAAG